MQLYNKDILEYAQIAQSEPKFRILNIEGRSNKYSTFLFINHNIQQLKASYASFANADFIIKPEVIAFTKSEIIFQKMNGLFSVTVCRIFLDLLFHLKS